MAETINYIGTLHASKKGGPIEQYSMTQFTAGAKVLSATHDVSVTGDQAITGAGFQPSGGIVFMTINGDVTACWFMFDSDVTIGALIAGKSGTADDFEPYTSGYLYPASGGTVSVTVTSRDTDGITLTWAKGGSPTGTATLKLLLFR
jgi:hypothetical protein